MAHSERVRVFEIAMKKGAIDLSVNFLVVIIIAIVILALSMVLFSDVFFKVQEADVELNQQYKDEIWRLLDSGGLVVAPLNTQTVPRGEVAKFGVGVRNIQNTQEFKIKVSPQNVSGCNALNDWLRIARPTRTIEANTQDIFAIGVAVPDDAKPCTYVFNVVINTNNVPYGTMQKLYVNVG